MVHELKRSFPELAIIINGGFTTLDQVADQLDKVDGVMLGRAVYQNPYLLAAVDRRFFGDTAPIRTREEVARSFQTYINMQIADGAHLKHMARHTVGSFQGRPGARKWRRYISESVHQHDAGPEVIREALKLIGEPT
jgi:tRNA-dihydrouridine synthase A